MSALELAWLGAVTGQRAAVVATIPGAGSIDDWWIVLSLVFAGIVAMASEYDPTVIADLAERLRRAKAGDDSVDFDLDRDDSVGALADALGEYVASTRECQTELQEKSTLLDSLFDQLPAHVYVKDDQARHVRTTTPYSFEDYSSDEAFFIGKTDKEIYPEELHRRSYPDDMRVIERGEPVINRIEYAPDIEEYVLTSKVPWRDDDGEIRGLIGISLFITDQKKRELAFQSLHEMTQELLAAGSIDDAARIVVDTAPSILDTEAVALYRYDEAANALEPTATSSAYDSRCGDTPTAIGPAESSTLWETYVSGTVEVVNESHDLGVGQPFRDDSHGVVVPLSGHGVLVAVTGEEAVDADRSKLAETVGATAEAVFDRLDTAAALREQETRLAAQNERLRRQIRINETIRSVHRSLQGATNRAELVATVCEQLADGDHVSLVFVGALDPSGDELVPREWAGVGDGYLDAVSFDCDISRAEPAVATALSNEPTLVETIDVTDQQTPWQQAALAADIRSALAVPVAVDEHSYGVLALYGSEADAFGDLEATVFAELGASIANAITGLTTTQALYADTVRRLSVRIEETDDVLVSVARSTSSTIRFVGLASSPDNGVRLFVDTQDVSPSTVGSAFADHPEVSSARTVRAVDGTARFEVALRADTLVSRLVRHGGRPNSIVADADGLDVSVDVPLSTDVRSFVARLDEDAAVELTGQREVTRTGEPEQAVVDAALDDLTERQRDVFRTAYFAGFYNWPRDTTGQELATILDISQPTVNRHLRLAERAIFAQLFALGDGGES